MKSTQSCIMVMDKLVAMKLISPITLVQWLLNDYHAIEAKQVRPPVLLGNYLDPRP